MKTAVRPPQWIRGCDVVQRDFTTRKPSPDDILEIRIRIELIVFFFRAPNLSSCRVLVGWDLKFFLN